MINCQSYLYTDNKGCIDTRYPKIPSNDTKYVIGIPFCSVLYEKEKQFSNLTAFGRINSIVGWVYPVLELLILIISMISFKLRKTIVVFSNNNKIERFKEIVLIAIKLILPFVILIPAYFLISYIFQVYVSYITSKNIVNFDPFTNLKKADKYFGDTLIIQILLFYCIFGLISQLKLVKLYGRCFIKHCSSIQNLITLSVVFSILEKLYSSTVNFVAESNLLINIYNCSILNTTVVCENKPKEIKLSDLRSIGNISNDYQAELNAYIYDNSLIEKVIMYVSYIFAMFLVFILLNTIYDSCDCFKSNLNIAKIEQTLRLIQHSQNSLINIWYAFKEKGQLKEYFHLNERLERKDGKKTCKSLANYLWKPFYLIFKRNDINNVIDFCKQMEIWYLDPESYNQAQLKLNRVLHELNSIETTMELDSNIQYET
jgi:hypothetical protein